VTCFLVGAYLSVALVFYDPAQSTIRQTTPTDRNPMGLVGADLVAALLYVFGISTWLLPFFLFWALYLALRNPRRVEMGRLAAMLVAFLSLAVLGAAVLSDWFTGRDWYPMGPGGAVGGGAYRHFFNGALGPVGSVLVLGAAYLIALAFVFTKDIGAEFEKILGLFSSWRSARAQRQEALAAEQAEWAKRRAQELKASKAAAPEPVGPLSKSVVVPKATETPPAPAKARAKEKEEDEAEELPLKARLAAAAAQTAAKKLELNIVKPDEPKKSRATPPPAPLGDDTYKMPPQSLLKEQVRGHASNSDEEHQANAQNLLRILGEFGVEVSLGEIHAGPVITRYELVPAPGVRVEKISGLDKNIALGMRAQSVRILAPIPGKAAVGVEVPNQHPTPVGLREILESDDWINSKAELPIALGKDVSGRPLISDLTKMPHLLIAGATGSGKSVCINAIIASILYSKTPREVRLFMVDPKVVELKIFNPLPHMLIPVLTEPKKVPAALKWLLNEMERRYQVFAKVNVRNILGFNNRKKGPVEPLPVTQESLPGVDPLDDGLEVPERYHYIVAIVDELADLMMVAPAEIETNIARLAQLARGAGIHLIIATQRPSVDVITGVIKANLPSRIAFQVASQVDSRTIIDGKGAESLIGRGDMLFTPPGTSRLVRAQGAFVSDEEVLTMVEYIKENNDPPVYFEHVQAQIDRASRDDEDEDGDESDDDMGDDGDLYKKALEVLKSSNRASTSMLQRRLRIGYNRAARIMEEMEENGIVGPENGSNPREILRDLNNL